MFESLVNRVKLLLTGTPNVPVEERRSLIRLPCRIVVKCALEGRELKAVVTDIGLNGMRLETVKPLNSGQPMEVVCPGQPGGPVLCEVAWARRLPGAKTCSTGIRFTDSQENLGKSWVKPALQALGFTPGRIRERRQYVRIPASSRPRAAVANRSGDVLTEGYLMNLGVGGALVSLAVEVRVGLNIRLQVDPLGTLPPLDMLSEVRTCKKDVRNQKWVHGLRFSDAENPVVKKYMALLLKDYSAL